MFHWKSYVLNLNILFPTQFPLLYLFNPIRASMTVVSFHNNKGFIFKKNFFFSISSLTVCRRPSPLCPVDEEPLSRDKVRVSMETGHATTCNMWGDGQVAWTKSRFSHICPFICRITAIICSAIDFLLKNRDKRLKSLNIFARVQIGMRINFKVNYANLSVCNCVALWWKFWKYYDLTQNLLLNNTFWTHCRSNVIFTGQWSGQIVARPCLKSESSVFGLRPQFGSL